jgi:Allene oxide cyclase barrel like domain
MAGEEGTMGKGKRLGILGASIAVVALVVGAAIPALGSARQGAASTASGDTDNRQTIRVTAVFTEFDPNIDVGAEGFSLGDEVVFSGNLLRNGEQVGRIGVICTFVSTANQERVEAQCPTTSILPGGQITTQGTIVNRSLNFTLPITGGSGRYQGAGGQVVSRDVSTPTQPQVELTFQLEF